jgi:hypothetical protein
MKVESHASSDKQPNQAALLLNTAPCSHFSSQREESQKSEIEIK